MDNNGSDGDSVIMDKEVCDKLLMSDNDHPNLVPVEPPTGGAQVGGPSQVLSNNHGQYSTDIFFFYLFGLRAGFLITLAENLEEEKIQLLEHFDMRQLEGTLSPGYYKIAKTVMTVPTFKTNQTNTVRPLGVKNQLIRTFH